MKIENKNGLDAPVEYWSLSKEEREKQLNRCGPDGPINKMIPDHLLGANISESCNIHDFTFLAAQNQKDHRRSDEIFLKNMKKQIEKKQGHLVRRLVRKALAHIYYFSVRLYSFFH